MKPDKKKLLHTSYGGKVRVIADTVNHQYPLGSILENYDLFDRLFGVIIAPHPDHRVAVHGITVALTEENYEVVEETNGED